MGDNKKIAINSVIISIRLLIVTITSLLSSRIVLDELGASDFGLYNVVGGIVALLNIFNLSMISTTYRYLSFEIGKGDRGQSNKVFNSSLAIHVLFSVLIVLLGLSIGEWYINNHLNVQFNKFSDAKFIFRISILTTVISTIMVPYQGLLVAYEKFKVTAFVEVLTQIFKLILLVFLLPIVSNSLRWYSLIMMTITLVTNLSFYLYSRTHYNNIIRIRIIRDFKLFREMINYATWTLFGASANVGKMQGSAIIINLFFGSIVNASFAIASQIENFILSFSRTLNNAAIPQIIKNYSSGDIERSVRLTSYISKYTYLSMLLIAFPVINEMDFFLNLWLKEVPNGTVEFAQYMILGALFGCIGEGIPSLVYATGKIKSYQIVIHSLLLVGIPISILLYTLGFASYVLSIVYCIINLFLGFVKLLMLKRVVHFDIKIFYRNSYLKILLVSLPLIVFYLLYKPEITSIYEQIVSLLIIEIFLIINIVILGTDSKERILIIKYFKSLIYKK